MDMHRKAELNLKEQLTAVQRCPKFLGLNFAFFFLALILRLIENRIRMHMNRKVFSLSSSPKAGSTIT